MTARRREAARLAAALLVVLAPLVWRLDQPIVENYVGRQIPTAMVARNLDRGLGFLRPQLDTGPFPSYFLVEPPIYQSFAVGVHRLTGLPLSASGRLVSALSTALGALGLYLLARRRHGPSVALLSVLALGLLPVTVRYGRAFQPDALMLGLSVLGLALWDLAQSDDEARTRLVSTTLGWISLAAGFSAKVLSAHLLLPLIASILRPPRRLAWALLACSALLPTVLWYAHAASLLDQGSLASTRNADVWRQSMFDSSSFSPVSAARWLARAFSPAGLLLAGWGWLRRGWTSDRLWKLWALGLSLTAIVVARKLHHEYYGLMAAPLVALGVALGLTDLAAIGRVGRPLAWSAGIASAVLAVIQAAGTYSTPDEWTDLGPAADQVARLVPPEDWLVAPEALLFAADRRGCRLDWSPDGQARAASEWGAQSPVPPRDVLFLANFYRDHGARWLADLPGRLDAVPGARQALTDRYTTLVDGPHVVLVDLGSPRRDPEHARP